jgi:hypothetical protein
VAIIPDGRDSGYPPAFNRDKNGVSSDPLPHVVCRLVAEPHRQGRCIALMVESAQFLDRPAHDVDCIVGIGGLR